MLNLSTRQFEALNEASNNYFLRRIEGLVLQIRPELKKHTPPENLALFAKSISEQARKIGFSSEFEIAVFCAAFLQHGKDFYTNPSHILFDVVNRMDVEPILRATQLLFEIEKINQKTNTQEKFS